MNIRHLSLLSLSLLMTSLVAGAYDYDDDDLYYNPDKAKKTETKKKAAATDAAAGYYYVPNQVVEYQDPALYAPSTAGLPVDVDTYNRHGQFLVQGDSISLDELTAGNDSFEYTRRLERFYNEDIVNGSGDQQLIDYYYSQPATTDINVYVVNDPWSWNSWNYPWYSPFSSYWYNPYYYNSFYGPSWSFSWGYDPWYSWSWGPGFWSPAYWGPGYWGPGYIGPGWGGPGWGGVNRPVKPSNVAVNNPGSSRPHVPAGSMTSSGSTANRRPGAISVGANNPVTRPGSAATGTTRYPGTVTPGTAASHPSTGTGVSNTTNLNRGRGTVTTTPSNTTRRIGNTTNTSRPGSNATRSSSNSSWGSGSSGSYRSTGGGGSHSGMGGGGSTTRGRR